MATTRISPKKQITIPVEVFKKLRLDIGDYLEVGTQDDKIILTPKKLIPKDQAWFWTKEWQDKEREASEDIRKGNIKGPFTSNKELLKSLKAKR